MANGIRTSDPRGFNKGLSSKFRAGSRVRQTPEEGRRTYRPKRCGKNNKDEDNSPKTFYDKNVVFSCLNPYIKMCEYMGYLFLIFSSSSKKIRRSDVFVEFAVG